jgi:hypothetical protein
MGDVWGTSDVDFPRSDLRRGRTEATVGGVGCVAGTGGAEMSAD